MTPTDCSAPQVPPGEEPPPATSPPTQPPNCAGEPAARVAGSARTIVASPGDDVIVADERDTKVKAGGGDDIVCGLAGNDSLPLLLRPLPALATRPGSATTPSPPGR